MMGVAETWNTEVRTSDDIPRRGGDGGGGATVRKTQDVVEHPDTVESDRFPKRKPENIPLFWSIFQENTETEQRYTDINVE